MLCLGFSTVTIPASLPFSWYLGITCPCGCRRRRGAEPLDATWPSWATVFASGAEERAGPLAADVWARSEQCQGKHPKTFKAMACPSLKTGRVAKINLAVMTKETEGTEWGPAPSQRGKSSAWPWPAPWREGHWAGLAKGKAAPLQLSPWGSTRDGLRQ